MEPGYTMLHTLKSVQMYWKRLYNYKLYIFVHPNKESHLLQEYRNKSLIIENSVLTSMSASLVLSLVIEFQVGSLSNSSHVLCTKAVR